MSYQSQASVMKIYYSEDKIINQQGKALIELCKSTDLKITNGRYSDDRDIGSYTCYKYNGKSTVDYVLLSPLYC